MNDRQNRFPREISILASATNEWQPAAGFTATIVNGLARQGMLDVRAPPPFRTAAGFVCGSSVTVEFRRVQ